MKTALGLKEWNNMTASSSRETLPCFLNTMSASSSLETPPSFLKDHDWQQFSRDPSFLRHQPLVFLPLWRTDFSDVNSYRSPHSTFDPAASSYLSLGFSEKHLVSAPEGFFESCCRVCEQLWLVRSIGVHVDRGIPCCIHASMTIKHSKVGSVHRVLVGAQWDSDPQAAALIWGGCSPGSN